MHGARVTRGRAKSKGASLSLLFDALDKLALTRRPSMTHNRRRLFDRISKILLLLVLSIIATANATAQVWTVLAADTKGDARDPSLADAAQVSYRYDKQQDLLWFRVSLYSKPNEESLGVNIAVDSGADEAAKMNWWGANKDFQFDKLVTVQVPRASGGR